MTDRVSDGPCVVVRDARRGEIEAIATIHRRAVAVAYKDLFPADAPMPTTDSLAEEWRTVLDASPPLAAMVAAESSGAPVGTIAVGPFPDDPSVGQIRLLHVDPSAWGRGVGTVLHDAALARLRRAGFTDAVLWVLRGNARARRMYERRGWRIVDGEVLILAAGVVEVQYRLDLRQPDSIG